MRAPARAGWSARRDHAAEDTRRALLGAAQRAFARDGYAATSLEAIVGAAGLTKGALYHHFGNKAGVLEALCLELQEALAARLAAAAAAASDDPWARAEIVVDAWCDAAAEPAYRQIVLRDAPGVLGASRLRDIDLRALLGVLTGVVGELVAAQQIRSVPIEATARVLLAAAVGVAFVSRVAKNFQDYFINVITQRLGAQIYGVEGDVLETSVVQALIARGFSVAHWRVATAISAKSAGVVP